MSSFKIKKNTIQTCYHCKNTYLIYKHKCPTCDLFNLKINTNHINIKHNIIKNIYIINLEKDRYRLINFYNNLKKMYIPIKKRNWKRFNAINGLDFNIIKKEIENLPITVKNKVIEYWKKNPGSIGCYLSHIKLWEYIYNNKESDEYTLILEDDSIITPNGLINLDLSLKKCINIQWDILYAGHNMLYGAKVHPLFLKPYSVDPKKNNKGFNSGLFGYVIKKSSIPKLLFILKKFETPYIDVTIRNYFGNNKNNIHGLFIINSLIKHTSGISSRKTFDKKII